MGKKTKEALNSAAKASKHVIEQNTDESEREQIEEQAPKYDAHTQRLIEKQAASSLLYLMFYSLLMFTLPFASFFGARHYLREHFQLTDFEITAWSVTASVITVYIIIALYCYKAYTEKDVPINPDQGKQADAAAAAKKKK